MTKAGYPRCRVNTLDEVAALLRISRGSAYEAAKRKEIPTIRIGRRLLVPSDALDRLLSGKNADPSPVVTPMSGEATSPFPLHRTARVRRRLSKPRSR
jgi:excisionase family DNA binding protein